MSNLTSPAFDTPGTRYCGARWWASGPVGCKVLPPRPYAAQRPFSGPPGTRWGRGVGAGIATWGGRGRALVTGVVVGSGVTLCYDILLSGWERKKGSSPYRNIPRRKTLSPDLFAYDSSPTYSASPPAGPFRNQAITG